MFNEVSVGFPDKDETLEPWRVAGVSCVTVEFLPSRDKGGFSGPRLLCSAANTGLKRPARTLSCWRVFTVGEPVQTRRSLVSPSLLTLLMAGG